MKLWPLFSSSFIRVDYPTFCQSKVVIDSAVNLPFFLPWWPLTVSCGLGRRSVKNLPLPCQAQPPAVLSQLVNCRWMVLSSPHDYPASNQTGEHVIKYLRGLQSLLFYRKPGGDTHTGGLADCDGQIVGFALTALQRHSFLLRPFLIFFHLLNATQWKQSANQEASLEQQDLTQKEPSSWVASLVCSLADRCPHLVPLHECFVLPAESLDLLVQLHVPLMIPLGHHVTVSLGGHERS